MRTSKMIELWSIKFSGENVERFKRLQISTSYTAELETRLITNDEDQNGNVAECLENGEGADKLIEVLMPLTALK